jgi:Flp pilus assembly protein TadG
MTRRARGEHGASLVEFALILPVFAMLMLGTITGGLAYNRKLAVTASARESVRFAATLAPPNPSDSDMQRWADEVHDVAVASADGELGTGDSGRFVCVALISSGSFFRVTYDGGSVSGVQRDTACFTEDPPLTRSRVQVVTRRTSTFEAMVFSRDLTLEYNAVARYEAG